MKNAMLAVLLCLAPVIASAQGFEITPFAQYSTGANFDIVDGEGFTRHSSFDASGGFGVSLEYVSSPDTRMGLYLARQSTTYRDERYPDVASGDINLDVDYYHFEGKYIARRSPRSAPYIEMSAGATTMRPETGGTGTRFSVGIGGGISYDMSRYLALRFDGRVLTTMSGSYGAVTCSPGFCAAAVSGGSFTQFVASAGVTFRGGQ